jgi:anti-anti-sigma factor
MVVDVINLSKAVGDTTDLHNIAVKVVAAHVFDAEDSSSMMVILTALIKGGIYKIAVDMKGLEYIDSRGIGTLINAAKLIREHHGDLVLYDVPEQIDKIFQPVNLPRFIKIFAAEQETLNYLKYL